MEPITRLLIERDCQRLGVDYARRADDRNPAVADLFTEDARLQLAGADLTGREAIRAYFGREREPSVSRHLISNVAIEVVDQDRATGLSELLYFTGVPKDGVVRQAELIPGAIATYVDDYRRTPDGWRIASRRAVLKFVRTGS